MSAVGFSGGLSPWLADSYLHAVSSHGLSSVRVCVLIFCYKDARHIGLGATLMTSFYLNFLFKDPLANIVTF